MTVEVAMDVFYVVSMQSRLQGLLFSCLTGTRQRQMQSFKRCILHCYFACRERVPCGRTVGKKGKGSGFI